LNEAATKAGLAPYAVGTLYARLKASVSDYTEAVYSNVLTLTVTPYAGKYPSIYVPGAHQGWDPATAPEIFAINYDGTYEGYVNFGGGTEFKFTAQRSWDGVNYGDGGAGKLSTDGGAGNLSVPSTGFYYVKADTEALTWSAELRNWGVIGDAQGSWDVDTDMVYDAATNTLKITLNLEGGKEMKFRANDSWDLNYGDTGADGTLEEGGDNIKIAESGTYEITLDLSDPAAPTYSIEFAGTLPALYVVGNYQGWDPSSAPAIYSYTKDEVYTGYVYISEATAFKFTSQQNWDGPNYGDGGVGKLSTDGGDIQLTETGYTFFTVNTADLSWSSEVQSWGVIGDATPGGWDADTDLAYDAASNTLQATVSLTAGKIKFRANDAWDLNYGDDDMDGILEKGGADIVVAEAGTYLITLDLSKLDKPTYSLQLQ
jgi:hypothetical protein